MVRGQAPRPTIVELAERAARLTGSHVTTPRRSADGWKHFISIQKHHVRREGAAEKRLKEESAREAPDFELELVLV